MFLAVVLLLLSCVSLSDACSCFPHNGPDRYCQYDLMFRGTAVAEYEEREEPIDHSDPLWRYDPFSDWVYTVRVEKAIKMPENLTKETTITMRTSTQGSLCGTRFPLDVSIVFFARVNDQGEIETGLCEPNTPWEALSDWDRELITEHIVDYCDSKDASSSSSSSDSSSAPPPPPPPGGPRALN
ncbi:metalloproteinase inhibitor 3-like [Babylonia areolata]|uniref:metalloproteinase inhibitor 3-like n=1 Tax=Babylonia areolata TaxID=304850 RepID=UPI003FCEF19D